MNKNQQKRLRKIASQLPRVVEVYRELSISRAKWRDILLSYQVKFNNLSEERRKQIYDQYFEEKRRPVNHYRRLKRVLAKEGHEGVLRYIERVSKIVNQNGTKKQA